MVKFKYGSCCTAPRLALRGQGFEMQNVGLVIKGTGFSMYKGWDLSLIRGDRMVVGRFMDRPEGHKTYDLILR